jgi:hypothetical protein
MTTGTLRSSAASTPGWPSGSEMMQNASTIAARTASAVGPPRLENDAGRSTSDVAARSASAATPPRVAIAAGSSKA